jgi:hypothetical protein
MGFLITVAGYNVTDEENEAIRKVYKIKKQNDQNIQRESQDWRIPNIFFKYNPSMNNLPENQKRDRQNNFQQSLQSDV